jgi:hypothetical protein
MKTLIIYTDIENPLKYAIVDGDYSKFHGVCVNSCDGSGFEEEFCAWMFDVDGHEKIKFSEDKSLLENKDWDKVAICTFLP